MEIVPLGKIPSLHESDIKTCFYITFKAQTLNAMLISFFQFICNQLKKVPPFVSADLSGKTVLVVGANVGIGYETAKYLATLNPGKLILACRSLSRGEAALASPFYFVLCFVRAS